MKEYFSPTEAELMEYAENNINSSSTKYRNGTVWSSKYFGDFEVIGKISGAVYLIKFIKTGFITYANSQNIRQGDIKDYMSPSVLGVGYIGLGKYSPKSHPDIYRRWKGVLTRCYSEDYLSKNPTYRGCSMDSAWHNFQTFCNDIVEIMKANNISSLDGYHLDKDIKQPNQSNKIYSKDTITISTVRENISEALPRTLKSLVVNHANKRLTGKTYCARNILTGEIIEFISQSEFCRANEVSPRGLSEVLSGRQNMVSHYQIYEKGSDTELIPAFVAIHTDGTVEVFKKLFDFYSKYNITRVRAERAVKTGKLVDDWLLYKKIM